VTGAQEGKPTSRPHLVWDWNGTLLDDRVLILDSIGSALRDAGFAAVPAARMRADFTRPLRAMFERLVRRPLTSDEWSLLEPTFRRNYQGRLPHASLVPGVREVLADVRSNGGRQSLVSLWDHAELVRVVRRHRLTEYFDEVTGRNGEERDDKGAMLMTLLHRRSLHPDDVVLIGDAHDDVSAADAAGVRAVIVVGASLEQVDANHCATRGVPVARTLAEAAALAGSLSPASVAGPPLS
jgi:phosphoglycolate phosphatase-like HAD superfamily hydrolase